MESFIILLYIIAGIVCGILPIILFFKVWNMCNEVSSIRRILEEKYRHDLIS